MKSLKCLCKYFLYYIIGDVLFNIVYDITQMILLKKLGRNENIMLILKENFFDVIPLYTVIFCIILIVLIINNLMLTRKLNKQLKIIMERRNKDEK